jgi:hypothetical protein
VPARVFEVATIRVVPRIDREEFINVGVVLHSPEAAFLDCRVELEGARLAALAPRLSCAMVERHLQAFVAVCRGERGAGPIAALPRGERFHWLVAPRSAMIQTSAVHAGVADDPAAALERLFRAQVGPV